MKIQINAKHVYYSTLIFLSLVSLLKIKADVNKINFPKDNRGRVINYDSKINSSIKWETLIKDRKREQLIEWEKYKINPEEEKKIIKKDNKLSLSSLNRSIVFNNKIIGPDISWIVPPGLIWNEK